MKKLVTNILIRRTAKYIDKKRPKIVVVTGSVGKTSTTQAIATVLNDKYSVLTTQKSYNTDVGVIMTIFGQNIVTNPIAWFWLSLKVVFFSFGRPKHEIYVLELGADQPGEIRRFAYLNPDIAVVSAVVPEHMELFKTIEAVASEELATMAFSKVVLLNKKMVAQKFVDIERAKLSLSSDAIEYYSRDEIKNIKANLKVVGEHSLDAVAAAAKIAGKLGFSDSEMKAAIEKIVPQPGRMNKLNGIKGSTLIDDTYNSSPDAVKAALKYLYSVKAPQRIVLLGNMNELGEHSEAAHRTIGRLCDPSKLDAVFTLGVDANKYLAEEAEKADCKVTRCESPTQAGSMIKEILQEGAIVLLKGSQNGVFTEEATKVLLEDPEDVSKLVRQTGHWPGMKRKQFKDMTI